MVRAGALALIATLGLFGSFVAEAVLLSRSHRGEQPTNKSAVAAAAIKKTEGATKGEKKVDEVCKMKGRRPVFKNGTKMMPRKKKSRHRHPGEKKNRTKTGKSAGFMRLRTRKITEAERQKRLREGAVTLESTYKIRSITEGFSGPQYLYVSQLGGVSTSSDCENDAQCDWTVTVSGSEVVLANSRWPDELLTMTEDCDEDESFNCDYKAATCSEDDMFGCYDKWEVFEPSNPDADQEGSVLLYNVDEEMYVESDCSDTGIERNSALWFFEPGLPDTAIAGTKELSTGLGAIFR